MPLVDVGNGVRLSCRDQGSGPLLVLVHGSGTDHRCFDRVVELFAAYRVVAYDRRGHGRSDGEATSDTAAEVTDLKSVIAHFRASGVPVFILAYSYGALITLQALATGAVTVDAAVLYEPPMSDPEMLPAAAEVVRLVAQGAHDAAMKLFVETTFHLPVRVVEAMRQGPMWAVAVDHASTLPFELQAVTTAVVPEPVQATPPIHVLVAEEGGNAAFLRIAEQIRARFDACRVVRIPGLPHFAMDTKPAEFAAAVRSCMETEEPPCGS